VSLGNHPVFAHFVREATPPNLGGEYAIADKLAYNTAPFLRIAYKGDSPYAREN